MQRLIVAIVLGLAILAGVVAQAAVPPPGAPIDINHADVADLMKLPGVGVQRAQAILRFRSAQPFRRPSDLMRIKGLGRRTFLKLKPFVAVGPESRDNRPRSDAGAAGAPSPTPAS